MSFIFENGHRNISPPCSSSQSELKKNVNTFSYPTAKRKKVQKERTVDIFSTERTRGTTQNLSCPFEARLKTKVPNKEHLEYSGIKKIKKQQNHLEKIIRTWENNEDVREIYALEGSRTQSQNLIKYNYLCSESVH